MMLSSIFLQKYYFFSETTFFAAYFVATIGEKALQTTKKWQNMAGISFLLFIMVSPP
jgi:hypothetical protein